MKLKQIVQESNMSLNLIQQYVKGLQPAQQGALLRQSLVNGGYLDTKFTQAKYVGTGDKGAYVAVFKIVYADSDAKGGYGSGNVYVQADANGRLNADF